MDLWNWIEYGAWGLSADSSYSEDVLTSSREGELEAMAEEHAEKHGMKT